jgi:hypothetical protein
LEQRNQWRQPCGADFVRATIAALGGHRD